MENEHVVTLDVREDLKLKKEPFDKIMGVVKQLKEGQVFELHAPFNPLPLHKVMGRKGFEYEAEKIDKRHWKVIYRKRRING